MLRQPAPLLIRDRGVAGETGTEPRFKRRDIVELRFIDNIGGYRLKSVRRHQSADIVQDQARDWRIGLRRQHHTNKTAHGRAEPGYLFDIQPCDQRGHVG